jgi:hypothetical protein
VVELLTLIGPTKSLFRASARLIFGYKRLAEVVSTPSRIQVREGLYVFGREVRQRTYVLDVSSLAEITLTTPHTDLVWLARLAPLTIGTCIGLALVGRAAVGWSYATELAIAGAFVLVVGIALDYFTARAPGPERAKLFLASRHSPPLLLLGSHSELRPWVEIWMMGNPPKDALPAPSA